jgi:hypothetical protein
VLIKKKKKKRVIKEGKLLEVTYYSEKYGKDRRKENYNFSLKTKEYKILRR